ncbi:MAG TPA: azurin [Rhodanobacteraceae bacterium]|nr:azurin [Rhodanobacteraceae bacterium]
MKRQLIAAAVLGLLSAPLWAADCSTTVEANDMMQYNTSSITVPASCKQFTVTLKHTGTLARNVMGHNWVLAKTADEPGVDADGMKAGLDNNYVKPGDPRVIAHTKVIGGGQSDSVTFATSKLAAGGDYTFFCSYPGHAAIMKGTLVFK